MEWAINSHRFNSRSLEEKTLHVCFQKTDQGAALAHMLNQGLGMIDVDAVMSEALA